MRYTIYIKTVAKVIRGELSRWNALVLIRDKENFKKLPVKFQDELYHIDDLCQDSI